MTAKNYLVEWFDSKARHVTEKNQKVYGKNSLYGIYKNLKQFRYL